MYGILARAAVGTIAVAAVATVGPYSAQTAQAAAAPVKVDVPCSAAALASDVTSASSGETLSLAPACVYLLVAGLPVISQDLTIAGNGATLKRSLAPGTPAFTILEVDAGTVALSRLNFRNGRGAIVVNNIGNVMVSGGTFTGNAATDGGAIADNSALDGLTVKGATFIGNTATNGGAIFDFSAVGATVTDSTFFGNHAINGGAIFADPDVETSLSGIVAHGNSATAGGGIYNVTNVAVTNSRIWDNRASGQGGGLYNSGAQPGQAQVTSTVLRGNSAQDGAGAYNADGIVSFSDSMISGNYARASGGGLYDSGDPRGQLGNLSLTDSQVTGNHARASGGGIYNDSGEVDAASTRIAVNTAAAGGGIDTHGAVTVTLTASTVIKNIPDNCEPPGSITGCAN
jgi:predicted outer membrane repeat protein